MEFSSWETRPDQVNEAARLTELRSVVYGDANGVFGQSHVRKFAEWFASSRDEQLNFVWPLFAHPMASRSPVALKVLECWLHSRGLSRFSTQGHAVSSSSQSPNNSSNKEDGLTLLTAAASSIQSPKNAPRTPSFSSRSYYTPSSAPTSSKPSPFLPAAEHPSSSSGATSETVRARSLSPIQSATPPLIGHKGTSGSSAFKPASRSTSPIPLSNNTPTSISSATANQKTQHSDADNSSQPLEPAIMLMRLAARSPAPDAGATVSSSTADRTLNQVKKEPSQSSRRRHSHPKSGSKVTLHCSNRLCLATSTDGSAIKEGWQWRTRNGSIVWFCVDCVVAFDAKNQCLYCSQLYREGPNLASDDMDWIQCDKCTKWVHVECEDRAGYHEIHRILSADNAWYNCGGCRLKDTKKLRQDGNSQNVLSASDASAALSPPSSSSSKTRSGKQLQDKVPPRPPHSVALQRESSSSVSDGDSPFSAAVVPNSDSPQSPKRRRLS
eukprot:GILK01009936.1.p1 GENE.GILK01009936.1~~GILK01009936.1.p1  ORF type:complete len:509 (-),score=23.65 GILK01009936.1:344-1831(-)